MSATTQKVIVSPQWQARCEECSWRGAAYRDITKADAQGFLHDVLMHPESPDLGTTEPKAKD